MQPCASKIDFWYRFLQTGMAGSEVGWSTITTWMFVMKDVFQWLEIKEAHLDMLLLLFCTHLNM